MTGTYHKDTTTKKEKWVKKFAPARFFIFFRNFVVGGYKLDLVFLLFVFSYALLIDGFESLLVVLVVHGVGRVP